MCGPSGNNILPVISHSPLQWSRGRGQRPSTHRGVVSKEHGTGNNQDNELNKARDEGAVGREDTCSPSPGSNEHAEEIEHDEAKGKLVDAGDNTQTTAKFLAVGIAVVNDVNISLK